MKKTFAFMCCLLLMCIMTACGNDAGRDMTPTISNSNMAPQENVVLGKSLSADTQPSVNRKTSVNKQLVSALPETNIPKAENGVAENDKKDTTVNHTSTPPPVAEVSSESVSDPIPFPSPAPEVATDSSVYQIQIVVDDQTFAAVLYKNETADALMERLPMTLDMGDMNKNEKYYYLSDNLPTNSERPSTIHSGDLMLYGSDCLVLFYESFSSRYNYTPLGYVKDISGLASTLGSGNVQVTFNAE